MLIIIFLFLDLVFLRKKRKGLVVDFFSPQVCCLKWTFKYHNMNLMLKAEQMFLKCYHDNTIKIFSLWPKNCSDLVVNYSLLNMSNIL